MVSSLRGIDLRIWAATCMWLMVSAGNAQLQDNEVQVLAAFIKPLKIKDKEVEDSWKPLMSPTGPVNCSELKGVTCVPTGTNIISLKLSGAFSSGQVVSGFNLNFLQFLDLSDCGLTGDLNFVNGLPSIVVLNLADNKYSGPFRLYGKPTLLKLYLQNNEFTEVADGTLSSLAALQRCDLSGNQLSGSLPQIPQSLRYLDVRNQKPPGGFRNDVPSSYCPLFNAKAFKYEGNPEIILDNLHCEGIAPAPASIPDKEPPGAATPPAPGLDTPETPLPAPPLPVVPVPAPPGPPGLDPSPSPVLPGVLPSPSPTVLPDGPPASCPACLPNQVARPDASCTCVNPFFADITITKPFSMWPDLQTGFVASVAKLTELVPEQVLVVSAKEGSIITSLALLPPPPSVSFDKPTIDRINATLSNNKSPIFGNNVGMVTITSATSPTVILEPTAPAAEKKKKGKGGANVGVIAGAIIAGLVILVAILVFLVCYVFRGRKRKHNNSNKLDYLPDSSDYVQPEDVMPTSPVLKPERSAKTREYTKKEPVKKEPKQPKKSLVTNRVFAFKELQTATNFFGRENLIGEGPLGRVYKAQLPTGQLLAVKRLDNLTADKERDFMSIVNTVGRLRHENLVELEGYCASEPGTHALAYAYVANGSLFDHLHAAESGQMLMWTHRVRIALGAARALEYIHETVSPPVIHRNFKSANILLDEEYTPKVADSGLAAFGGGPGEKVSTQMLGTFGYAAPEYAMTGQHTAKSDVYSFGVVCLELLTGRRPLDSSRPRMEQSLVRWAVPQLQDVDALAKMADPKLQGHYPIKSLARFADIIALCVQPEPEFRPPMSEVVQALVRLQQRTSNPAKSGDNDSGTPGSFYSGNNSLRSDGLV